MVARKAASPASAADPGRILVVDDEPDVRRMLGRMLRTQKHTTSEASTARAAVDLVRQNTFDLVVSDVQMPDMNGVELLHAVREIDPDLPVLLLSGAPDLSTAMKAVEYGAFEYLTKPFPLEKFLASAARAIEVGRRRREDQTALRQFRSGERLGNPRAPSGEPRSGVLLGGRYRLGRVIGQGGMGAVYEAVREDLAAMRVAVKVLHPSIEDDADYLVRFRREAETVAAVNHPNIVRIFDFHARDGEPAYLVMELLEGTSLARAILLDGPFTQQRAAFVASQILSALEAAHRVNVVHRDLKPENVFLTSTSGLKDIVKLLDFGVAKVLGGEPVKLTQTGAVLGTPAYMAPEQARGAAIDARSDVYAVGCVLYECLTGRAPFQADNYHALLFAIQQSEPPPVRELRPDLDLEFANVIATAMAKDPNARFRSAEEMIVALARLSLGSPPLDRPEPRSSPIAFARTASSALRDVPPEVNAGARKGSA